MKWQDDEYKDMKYQILDVITQGFDQEQAHRISFYTVFKAIDNLFNQIEEEIK